MTSNEHVRTELGAYLLGALDPDESAAVTRHLESCERCRADYAALAPLPGLLSTATNAEAAGAEPLPPAFEERLLDAFARDRAGTPAPRRRLPRWRWLGATAAAVAAAALALLLLVGGGDDAPRRYNLPFEPAAAGANARAKGWLQNVEAGSKLYLAVSGLPHDPEAVYEVMCDAPGWSASAGTFRSDGRGRARVTLTTALRRGEYDAIRVVRKREGGARDVFVARLS